MKLYTEEQVRDAFDKGYKYAQNILPASIEFHMQYVEREINSLIPIELPSDEEIRKESMEFYDNNGADIYFIQGAKWVIEQIKQQDK